MLLDALQLAALQTTPVILVVWAAGRFLSPKVQVWLWRLVFLRLTVGLFLWPTFDLPVLKPIESVYSEATGVYVPAPEPFPIWQVLWAFGVAVLCLVALRETWQVRRLVTEAGKTQNEPKEASQASEYRISDRAKTPMVIGLFRPVILIPRDIAESSSPQELRMIVAHEQGHIANGDLVWAWVVWAGRAAFFFHPLVWIAARCERFARETAADKFAIEKTGADSYGYGQILLRIALADPLPSRLSPVGLTMSDSYRFVYRRLETMKTFSRRPSLNRLLSTTALCAVTLGLLPAFNFVPAMAQTPAEDATEPVVYQVPLPSATTSEVAIVAVQNQAKPPATRKPAKAQVKVQAANRARKAASAPRVALPSAAVSPAIAPRPALVAVPEPYSVDLPATPALAPAPPSASVPALPAPARRASLRGLPATAHVLVAPLPPNVPPALRAAPQTMPPAMPATPSPQSVPPLPAIAPARRATIQPAPPMGAPVATLTLDAMPPAHLVDLAQTPAKARLLRVQTVDGTKVRLRLVTPTVICPVETTTVPTARVETVRLIVPTVRLATTAQVTLQARPRLNLRTTQTVRLSNGKLRTTARIVTVQATPPAPKKKN